MFKRILLYLIGTLTLGLGLVLNSKTGLGNAPISSVPYALSLMTPLTFGTCTTLMYVLFIIIQCLLKKKISLKVLLQLPFSYVFGLLLDFYNRFIHISKPALPIAILLALLAIVITALGVVFMVAMDLIVNPADGLVGALADFFHVPFGKAKTCFDIGMFTTTLLLTLIFLHHVDAVGLGSVLAVCLVGNCINFFNRLFKEKLLHFAFPNKEKE